MSRHQAGTLANEDDATLNKAVLQLEQAEANFFVGVDTSTWTMAELSLARNLRQSYLRVANQILRLLLTRYGCND